MSFFPHLELENIVQVDDRTRLKAMKSYGDKNQSPVTKVEIKPESTAAYFQVQGTIQTDETEWFLDWQYSTAGTKTVSLQFTFDDLSTIVFTKDITIISIADDKLFSSDSDLINFEPDILKWVPEGRNSFLNIHRRSQNEILAWLDEKGHTDINGDRLTKANIVDIQEVKEWSTFMTLRLIFDGLSNAIDDIFREKSKIYRDKELKALNRSIFRFDYNNDGIIDQGENIRISTSRLRRV